LTRKMLWLFFPTFFKCPNRTWTFVIEHFVIFFQPFFNVATFKCANRTCSQLCLTCRTYLLIFFYSFCFRLSSFTSLCFI
jgi:hypothetical protein